LVLIFSSRIPFTGYAFSDVPTGTIVFFVVLVTQLPRNSPNST